MLVPEALPRRIDGSGGISPAVLLSSTMTGNGDRFNGLGEFVSLLICSEHRKKLGLRPAFVALLAGDPLI